MTKTEGNKMVPSVAMSDGNSSQRLALLRVEVWATRANVTVTGNGGVEMQQNKIRLSWLLEFRALTELEHGDVHAMCCG